jgi:hypothetical protein
MGSVWQFRFKCPIFAPLLLPNSNFVFSNTHQSACICVLEENCRESGWYTSIAKLQKIKAKKRKKEEARKKYIPFVSLEGP